MARRERDWDRRFSLADLMVLVAATGAGLAMLRPYLASSAWANFRFSHHSLRTIETTYGVWSFVAAWWMLALLILRYRSPRPSRARLFRRPGHVACSVAAVAMAVGMLEALVAFASSSWTSRPFTFVSFWIQISSGTGPIIAGAWFVLALSGRWQASPGWIDRLGRLLGCCWIGWILFWMLPGPIREKIPPFWNGVLY